MRKMQSLNITLPADLARWVEKKVASGEYATESDVVADSLRDAVAEDAAIDQWVTDEVLPTLDAMAADPSRGSSPEDVRKRLYARIDELSRKRA